VLKNDVWSMRCRNAICCADVSAANDAAFGCCSRHGLKRGEAGAIVDGELREERRERAVDEVDDAGFARAGCVVGRDDLRRDRFDVGRFGRGQKRDLRRASRLRVRRMRIVHRQRDLGPAERRRGGGDGGGDGLEKRSA
jgi:hypothetical protein